MASSGACAEDDRLAHWHLKEVIRWPAVSEAQLAFAKYQAGARQLHVHRASVRKCHIWLERSLRVATRQEPSLVLELGHLRVKRLLVQLLAARPLTTVGSRSGKKAVGHRLVGATVAGHAVQPVALDRPLERRLKFEVVVAGGARNSGQLPRAYKRFADRTQRHAQATVPTQGPDIG